MELRPRKDRPLAVSINRRNPKDESDQRHTLRITDPETKKRLNFGDKPTKDDAVKEAERIFVLYEEGRSLISLLPENNKKRKAVEAPRTPVSKGDIPLGEFIDTRYLPSLNVEPSTRADYQMMCERIKNYVDDAAELDDEGNPLRWKFKPLNTITNGEIHRFLNAFRNNTSGKFFEKASKTDDTYALNSGGKRRSKNYERKAAQRVRHIYTIAVRQGYLASNDHPYKDERLPKRPSLENDPKLVQEAVEDMLRILKREGGRTNWTTPEDVLWGREAEFWYYLILTAMWSGLRVSELLGSQYIDLLTKSSEVKVDTQWGWNAKKDADIRERLVDPKSKHSARTVPMPKTIFQEVWDWAEKVRLVSPDELIFPRPQIPHPESENPMRTGCWGYWGSPSNFNRRYREMQDRVWELYEEDYAKSGKVAVKHSRSQMMQVFHEYRHLWASICIVSFNLDLMSVYKWAGHHSPAFTAEVYARLIRQVHDKAADKMRNAGKPKQTTVI
ncbi:MAG: hypothetical protein CVT67_03015 [Actinobacteria bacterium HGW-Actinobacteria-7]|nr:MAG: hypothetical protein CVT67_03015 [Actinobacteria bacterium HGW-Actinobacteria-7]